MVLETIVGHYVKFGGTRIFFDEIGSGRPIVCIHTAGANSLEYRELLPLLAQKGYRVIALDLPGHGRSYLINDEPFREMHPYAEFVWSFAQEVCEDKPIIVGCSVGGSMTIDMVAHHSENIRAAIAMEGAARTPVFPDTSIAEQPAWYPGWQAGVEIVGVPSSANRNAGPDLLMELRYVHRNSQLVMAADLQCWSKHNVKGKLGKVRCPVLLMKGEESFHIAPELAHETVKEIPGAELLFLKGIGHYPMMEDPPRIAEIIADFLKRRLT